MNGLTSRRLILYSIRLRMWLMLRNLALSLLDILLVGEGTFGGIARLLSKHVYCIISVWDIIIISGHGIWSCIGHWGSILVERWILLDSRLSLPRILIDIVNLSVFFLLNFLHLFFFFFRDLIIKSISILFDGKLFIVVHVNFYRFFYDNFLFKTAKVLHVGVFKCLLDCEPLERVKNKQLL